MSIFPNANISAAYLLISHCGFSSLILSSIATISVQRLFLKCKGLAGARVVPITKRENGLHYILCKDASSLESQYLMND